MTLQELLDKAIAGDRDAYNQLIVLFGHEQMKIVDLGNKNRRLCEGIKAVLSNRDFLVRIEDVVQDGLKHVLEENEFIARPVQ